MHIYYTGEYTLSTYNIVGFKHGINETLHISVLYNEGFCPTFSSQPMEEEKTCVILTTVQGTGQFELSRKYEV